MDCERGATGNLIVVKQVSSVSFRVFQPLPFYWIIKIKIGKALATWKPPHTCLVACSERRWCVPWSCCSFHQCWGSALPLPGRISLQHLSYHCPICFLFSQPTFYVSWSSPAALPSSALISRALSFLLWQFSLSHWVGPLPPAWCFLLSSHSKLGSGLCGEICGERKYFWRTSLSLLGNVGRKVCG